MELTHVDQNGKAKMVDISEKKATIREAVAVGRISMSPATISLILNGNIPKGDVLAVARIAGIMAAKRTDDLIPMCHGILLDTVSLEFEPEGDRGSITIRSVVKCTYKTGVEMEALTAVSVAALTIYDMCKAVDRTMMIGEIRLIKKTGGKSDYQAVE